MLGILGSSSTVVTSLTEGLKTMGDDMMSVFVIVIPAALIIVGAKMVIKFGVSLFGTLTKKG